MRPRRLHAAAAAATAAGVLLAFAPVVAGSKTLSHRDTDRLYAPVRSLVVEALRGGRLPLWNPYEGTGKPLFAEGVHAVLHPLSLAAAAIAPGSIDVLILGYLLAAALGAFALAAALGASASAAAGAGVSFALSGYALSMTGNLVFLAGLSTLPWVVAAARAAGEGARWGSVGVALATGAAFLSGDAQTAVVGVALGVLVAADAGGRRGAARALAGAGAGLLLSAVQIVATRALLPLTYRGLELPDEQKAQWALAPARLLEWVLPGLLRGPIARLPVDASGPRPDALPFAESVYLGVPVVVAAALGVARRGRRTPVLLAGSLGVLLWLALGHHLGARQVLDGVPVWSRFRYAEKLMAPLTLCACALAALGIDAFGAAPLPRVARRALGGAAALAASALVVLVAAPGATAALAAGALGELGPFYRSTLAAGLPHLVAGLVGVLLVDRLRGPGPRAVAMAVLAASVAAAAAGAGRHLGEPAIHDAASPLRLGAGSPAPRLAHPVQAVYDPALNPDDAEVAARLAAAALTPSRNVAARVDTVEPYTGFEPLRLTALSRAFGAAWPTGFRRYGLTHVVIPVPHDDASREPAARAVEGGRLVQREVSAGLELWAVPHRPWAFFAEGALAAAGPDDAVRVVLELAARGDDATVVIETRTPPATAPGRVLGVRRGTDTLTVEAESAGPALLVVQDAFWPGWRAAVDGQAAEILPADGLVRAVRWPPGRHRLEMTYDPPELRTGLGLSAAGAVAVLLLAAAAARRRHTPPVP